MRIRELDIENFRGFRRCDIRFPDSNLAVFVGVNGAGKTAVLDCIAILLTHFSQKLRKKSHRESDFSLGEDDININAQFSFNKITANYDDEPLSWQIYKSVSVNDRKTKSDYKIINKFLHALHAKLVDEPALDLPLLIYYPAEKGMSENSGKISKLKQKRYAINQFYAYENNFRKVGNDFGDFLTWFRLEEDWENQNKVEKGLDFVNPNLNVVRNAIRLFFSSISSTDFADLKIKRVTRDGAYHYGDSRLRHASSLALRANNQELKINQLSAGQKILLLMVSDLAHRLAVANPSKKDPLRGKGVVLIDEIELHLHPQWQREVIPGLLRTFPNLQFIITTHSPQVLSNVEKEEVFILEDNNVVKSTPHTKGRDSNSILYELQGVEERPEKFKENLREIYRLIDDEEADKAKKLLQALTEKWGEEDTEIVKLNTHLNFLIG